MREFVLSRLSFGDDKKKSLRFVALRGNIAAIERNMGAADQIVDSISSTNNNNSNNDREVDGDFKRVNEVLESSKACVFSNPTFFLDKKIFPLPQNVHQKEALSTNFMWIVVCCKLSGVSWSILEMSCSRNLYVLKKKAFKP